MASPFRPGLIEQRGAAFALSKRRNWLLRLLWAKDAMGLIFVLTGPGFALGGLLQCDQERYYEGEKVHCTFNNSHEIVPSIQYVINVLDKELKKGWAAFDDKNKRQTIEFVSPSGLRAVTPIRIRWQELEVGDVEQPWHELKIQIYPRDAAYWVNPKEFAGKRIGLLYGAKWHPVVRELDALGVPYSKQALPTPLGGYDLIIVESEMAKSKEGYVILNSWLPRVKRGVKILVLEQSKWPADVTAINPGLSACTALVAHLRFEGIGLPSEIRSFSRWGAADGLSAQCLNIPESLSSKTLLGFIPDQEMGPQNAGANFSLTAEYAYGKGFYIFNQMPITDHFNSEPLARWWLVQLIRHALSEGNDAKEPDPKDVQS